MGIDNKSHSDEINGRLDAVRKGALVQRVLSLGFFVTNPLVPNPVLLAKWVPQAGTSS